MIVGFLQSRTLPDHLILIKILMDEVRQVRGDDANTLIMIKRFGRAS